jgi:hypothetical protein
VRGRWEGLDVINSKVDDGAGGARTFESLNVTCHLASFKSGRSFSSHARSLSFSYFRYPRGKFRSPGDAPVLSRMTLPSLVILSGERGGRLYLERPRSFFFSPVFFTRPVRVVLFAVSNLFTPKTLSIAAAAAATLAFDYVYTAGMKVQQDYFEPKKRRKRL